MEMREDEKKRVQDNIEGPYYRAIGSQELEQVLATLLENAQRDLHFAKKIHTILYEFGQQRSLIKVDFHQRKAWYNDLLGRPAPLIIKDAFSKYSFYFHDVYSLNLHEKLEDSIAGTFSFHDHNNIQQAHERLNTAIAEGAWNKNSLDRDRISISHRFFKKSNENEHPAIEQGRENSIKNTKP